MSAKYIAVPDIDRDDEVVYDEQGQRVTEARARQIAPDTFAIAPSGRPSPSAPGRGPPEVMARVPRELRARLQEADSSAHQHLRLDSQACERYLAS